MNIRQQYAVTVPHADLIDFLKERNAPLRDITLDVVEAKDTGLGIVVTLQEPAAMPEAFSEESTPF